MVKRLESLGLVSREPYHGVQLTPAGERVALEVLRHHRLLELYLAEALGMPWDRVHEEAEKLEHAISPELSELIAAKLGNPTHDPHGDPIPTRDGEIDESPTRALADLRPGERGVFSRVSDSNPDMLRYLSERGIAPGDEVELAGREPFGGPLTVRANGREHALGRPAGARHARRARPRGNLRAVALADDFQAVLDSLPPDWTQLELDLRIADEHRYIDAATLLVQINAMPYSEHDWHWRIRSAHDVRPRRGARDGARHARAAGRRGHRGRAGAARGALRAASRSSRCGAARSRCARSSTGAARSRRRTAWRASRCSARTCCSARSCRARCARRGTSRSAAGEEAEVLVVDLTDEPDARIAQAAGAGIPRLGFYSHVEQDVRRRAEEAGFERVVPRSRMAREAAALVESLL